MSYLNLVTRLAAAALAAGVGWVSTTAQASTYDPAAEFSPTANPNGVWSYGYSTSLGSAMTLFPEHLNMDGIDFWRTNIATSDPTVFHNGTARSLSRP
jgi:hypothetical protein